MWSYTERQAKYRLATRRQQPMDTKTILTTLDDLRLTASVLNLQNAALDGAKLVQQLQAAADAFTAAATAGDTADDSDTVSRVYETMANTLIGKHGVRTLMPFYEPIKNAHSKMATALEALAPGATTGVAERVTGVFEQPV
jgi:hypothetical protein